MTDLIDAEELAQLKDKIAKLPAWARALIYQQDARITQLEYTDKLAKEDVGPTDTYIETYDFKNGDKPLPKGTTINFAFSDKRYAHNGMPSEYLSVRVTKDRKIEIQGVSPLSIDMYSSNMFYITLRD